MFKKMKFSPQNRDEMVKAQNALFKLGYRWSGYGQNIAYSNQNFLYTNEFGTITHGDDAEYFNSREGVEVILVTMTTVVHTLEEVIKPETVELNGKTYLKADLEAALEKLKPVEE